MEGNNKIVVDSNFFIALFNGKDSLHKKALLIAKELKHNNAKLFISNFIFLETTTVVSQKVSRVAALTVGATLLDSGQFNFIYIDKYLHERAWKYFKAIKRKNTSFVDCSLLAVMEYIGINKLLTFDIADFALLRKKYSFTFYN